MLAEVRPGRCQLYLEFRDREHENKGRKGEESDPGQQLGRPQWVFRSLTRGGRRQNSRARPWYEDRNQDEIAGRAKVVLEKHILRNIQKPVRSEARRVGKEDV